MNHGRRTSLREAGTIQRHVIVAFVRLAALPAVSAMNGPHSKLSDWRLTATPRGAARTYAAITLGALPWPDQAKTASETEEQSAKQLASVLPAHIETLTVGGPHQKERHVRSRLRKSCRV